MHIQTRLRGKKWDEINEPKIFLEIKKVQSQDSTFNMRRIDIEIEIDRDSFVIKIYFVVI